MLGPEVCKEALIARCYITSSLRFPPSPRNGQPWQLRKVFDETKRDAVD
jgi:hypothetical protein